MIQEQGDYLLTFVADDVGKSTLRVTNQYDNQAKFDYYEPATEDNGRHIKYRVGSNQMLPWTKYEIQVLYNPRH